MYLGIFSINDVVYFRANTVNQSGSALDASIGPGFQVFANDSETPLVTGTMDKIYSEEGTYEGSFTAVEALFSTGQHFVLLDATVDGETPKAHVTFQLVSDDLSLEETFQEIQMIGLSMPIVGSGTISIDHNFGGTDNYRVTASGTPLADVHIRAFVETDYDNGLRANKHIVGQSKTGTDGRWVAVIRLDPGDYVLEFSKPGSYRTATVDVTITARVESMSFSAFGVETMSTGMSMEPYASEMSSVQSFATPTPTPTVSINHDSKRKHNRNLETKAPTPRLTKEPLVLPRPITPTPPQQSVQAFSTPVSQPIYIDHNYKGKDTLRLISKGKGVEGIDIKIFKKSDYDYGQTEEKFIVQRTVTTIDGRWERSAKLQANENYVIEFGKKGEYALSAKTVSAGKNIEPYSAPQHFLTPTPPTFYIDHNYKGKDNFRLVSKGQGIEGIDVKIFKKADYDAKRTSETFIVQRTVTTKDGRWERSVPLQSNENYVIEFGKKGKFSTTTQVIKL